VSPIRIEDDPLRSRLQLVLSPASEMFNSLHVLAEPSHHPSNQDWVQAVTAAMAADLRAEVAHFGTLNQWLDLADLVHLTGPVDVPVPAFLDRLTLLPPETIMATALGNARGQAEWASADPVAFAARLVTTLRRYWQEVFAGEWDRRRPWLEQRRTQEASRLDGMSATRWLTELHDRISYDESSGELVFHKYREFRFVVSGLQRITCIPSTFSAPHLMVGYDDRQVWIYVNVALPVLTPERVPPGLLLVAKALADESRLLIYRAVLKRPNYTQELAQVLGLAEPTVSRHLKVLKAAGLVRSRKEGAVVLYAGVLEPVNRLPALMLEFMRG
jgi:DNA-binding transcriptional ArsR family regulator